MTAPTADDSDFVDYYTELDIAPAADAATIRARLDAETLEWQRFTGSHKKQLRHQAENRLELVAEAEKVLLDPRKRAAFDARRSARRSSATLADPAPNARPSSSPAAWSLDQARSALFGQDHKAARHFARMSTEQDPELSEAWFILYIACLTLGDLDLAEIAGSTAVRLRPDQVTWAAGFGEALVTVFGAPARGIDLLERATEMDETPGAGIDLSQALRRLDRSKEAMETMRALHQRFPDEQEVRDELVRALLCATEAIPAVNGTHQYVITSTTEIERMEKLLREARRRKTKDADALQGIDSISTSLQRVKEPVFTSRLFESREASNLTWWLTPIAFLIALAMLAGGHPLGMLFLIGSLFGVVLIVSHCRPPRWELNARTKAEHRSRIDMAERLRAQGL